MPEIEFTVMCTKVVHGELKSEWDGIDRHGTPVLSIEPCEQCLEDEYDRGKEDAE